MQINAYGKMLALESVQVLERRWVEVLERQ
jgi:hypothetical protein